MHVQTEHYDEPHTYGPGDFFQAIKLTMTKKYLKKELFPKPIPYPFQEKCRI